MAKWGVMAKELVFKINGKGFSFAVVKLDRKKLYGWSETPALDEKGEKCELVSMDASGTIVIPKGGIGMGAINSRGEWVNKSELVAVYEDGKPADLVPSSFSAPIELGDRVTVEELFDHEIKAVYQLDSKDGCEEFQKQLSGSGIYTFTFNYREDYEGMNAFLVGTEHFVYLLTGQKMEFSFVGSMKRG